MFYTWIFLVAIKWVSTIILFKTGHARDPNRLHRYLFVEYVRKSLSPVNHELLNRRKLRLLLVLRHSTVPS